MVYPQGEAKVQLFELQWRLHDSERVDRLQGVSSLDRTPWEKVRVEATKEWTVVPREAVDEGKRMVYIGGLDPCSPVVVFRVRARNLSGWGSWSRESEPISSLSATLPPPSVADVGSLTCTLEWKPRKNWEHYGQVLYYRLWARHAPSESADSPIPLGFSPPSTL